MNESLVPIFLSWLIPLAFMLLVFLLIRKRVLAWLGSPDYLADTGKATLSGFVRRGLALYIDYNLFYLPSQFLIIFIPLSAGTEKTLVGAFLVTFVLFKIAMEHFNGSTPGKRLAGLSVHGLAETPPSLISSGARNALLFILAALQINGVIRIGPRHSDPSLDNPSLDHLPVPLAIFSVIFLLLYLVDAFWYFRQGKRRMYHDVVAKTQVVPAGALHRYFWWVLFVLVALSNLTEALRKGAQSL